MVDLNNDGLVDLVLSRIAGTQVWLQEALTVQPDLGFGGPGTVVASVIGDDLTEPKSVARYQVNGAPGGSLVNVVLGLNNMPSPFKGGTLVPIPFVTVLSLPANANGAVGLLIRSSGGAPASAFTQAVVVDGGTYLFSNAVEIVLGV